MCVNYLDVFICVEARCAVEFEVVRAVEEVVIAKMFVVLPERRR